MNILRLAFFFCATLASIWLLTSCHPKKPLSNGLDNIIVNNPDTPKVVTPVVKKDTVKPPVRVNWCDTIEQNQYRKLVVCYEKIGSGPIKADTVKVLSTDPRTVVNNPNSRDTSKVIKLKDRYNVVIAMPFLSNRLGNTAESEIDGQSLKALEFYEGARIALDSLGREGIKLNVYVCDTKSGTQTIEELLKKDEFLQADLIIGPVAADQLKLVSEFSKQHQIPLVSPFNPNEEVIDENPLFIQVNPSFKSHSERIMQFIDTYKNKNPRLLILGTQDDTSRINQLQAAYAAYKNDINARIPVSISGSKTPATGSMGGTLASHGFNIVIVPSFKNEVYVYNTLRELQHIFDKPEQRGKKNEHIIVVGMPQWKSYESVNIEYYENLNLHIASEYAVDESQPLNRSFLRSYASIYGMPPREYGYIGFDVMLYFGRMLHKYSRSFPDFLFKEVASRRHTIFNFEPIYKVRSQLDSYGNTVTAPSVVRYENQYINIVKFNNFLFEKVY